MRHVLGAIHQGDYYVRLLNRSGKIIVKTGLQLEKADKKKMLTFACCLLNFAFLKAIAINKFPYRCILRIIKNGDTSKSGEVSKISTTIWLPSD